ncbi:MAG: hypothetical protein AAF544_12400, partial [Bacteroidota bacterium]
MSKRVITLIISLMTLTVLGLAAVQWILVEQSLAANEEHFINVTHDALHEAAQKQEQNEKNLITVGRNGFNRGLERDDPLPSITQRNLDQELDGDGPLSIPNQRLNIKPENSYESRPLTERLNFDLLERTLNTALQEGGIEVPFDYAVFEKA